MKDKLGQEITPGCYIVYGHVMGRSGGLRIGKVLKLDKKKDKWSDKLEDRITIQGVDAEWDHRPPQLLSKKSTLSFPNRTVVIDENNLPKVIFDLLEKVV